MTVYNELESIWKERDWVAYSRFYSGIFVKSLRKITRNLSQDKQCPDRNSNLAPFGRELTALPLCICFSPEAHKPYINSNNPLGTERVAQLSHDSSAYRNIHKYASGVNKTQTQLNFVKKSFRFSQRLASCRLVSCSADFRPWRWRRYFSPKLRITYGPQGAISQKIILLLFNWTANGI
jgi:hypothetical protein